MTAQETLDFLNSASIEASSFKRIFTVDKTEDVTIYNSIINDDAVIPKNQIIKLVGGDDGTVMVIGDGISAYSDCLKIGASGGSIPSGGTNTTFLRGDGTWATPTNTTYTAIAEAEASTGTATTVRAISAQSLKRDILNRTARFDSITEVSADRTLLLTDASKNKLISLTGGNTVTLTIPPSSSVAWVAGDVVKFSNTHAAKLSFVAGLGVNISSVDDFLAVSPKGWAELRYLGANSWHLIGTLYTGE